MPIAHDGEARLWVPLPALGVPVLGATVALLLGLALADTQKRLQARPEEQPNDRMAEGAKSGGLQFGVLLGRSRPRPASADAPRSGGSAYTSGHPSAAIAQFA